MARPAAAGRAQVRGFLPGQALRSEEHTSELQSHSEIVCRLLLEKKNSACRHPDWTGPDDLEIKIVELREITGWEKPIYVKIGATRTYYDVQLAVKAGADVIVLDGMQGGTAATQDVFIEHVGIPTLPAVRLAVDALQELGLRSEERRVGKEWRGGWSRLA